ncbi:SDR family oxidoreductase [Kineococcus sp. T13]|nr:SDR family oxidoreductase [Kineococcus vitellinus]
MVLVTGVGRRVGIGAAIAEQLARDGWDVATCHWAPYDDRMPWGRQEEDAERIQELLRAAGARSTAVPADLSRPEAPAEVFDAVEAALGPVTGLVVAHCESVDSSILDTSVDSFDRHVAVNARATWLLVAELARRFPPEAVGRGRIVAITSDHVVHNLPYGASKGAMDRIVLAAARELEHLRLTANVVNPGPVDTGWMDEALLREAVGRNPRGRAGRPQDTADLVSFLLSERGGWVNGQLLHSDGGWRS